MRKLILMFVLLFLNIFTSIDIFAETGTHDLLNQSTTNPYKTAGDENIKEEDSNKLPIIGTENFDTVIKKNILAEVVSNNITEDGGWLNLLIDSNLIITINTIIGAIAVLWLVILGLLFAVNQGNEEDMDKYKKRFGWTILGLFVVALAEFAGFMIFNPAENDLIGGNQAIENLIEKVEQLKLYFEITVVGVMLILGGLSAFRLIVGAESDDTLDEEKNFIKNFLFGFAFILMAEVLVRIFSNKTMRSLNESFNPEESSKIFVTETVGIINMILTYIGGAATFMMILASLYYVSSFGNEDRMNSAKNIIISCVVAIIIAFSSYTLVSFVIK